MKYVRNRIEWIRELNALIAKYSPSQKQIDRSLIDLEGDPELYDFLIPEYYKDLCVLGKGWFKMHAVGYVYPDGKYEVTLHYHAHDWFTNLFDLDNDISDRWVTFEFDDCIPYEMIAYWTVTISGDVDE